jgi:hypothetical protein
MLKKLSSVWILLVFSSFLSAICLAQQEGQPNSGGENSLRRFLRDYVGESNRYKMTRYSSAFVDLRDDGVREVIAYLSGRMWCGSGGCPLFILDPAGQSYRLIARTTITRLPIRVLSTKSNGWHDISVLVAGGGIQPGYEAVLSFDGKAYPNNPSTLPARRLEGKLEGKTVMPVTAEGKLLYQ